MWNVKCMIDRLVRNESARRKLLKCRKERKSQLAGTCVKTELPYLECGRRGDEE